MQAHRRGDELSPCFTFVLPARDAAMPRIRIFTPVNELPFAVAPAARTAVRRSAQRWAGTAAAGVPRGGNRPPVEYRVADGAVIVRPMQQPRPGLGTVQHAAPDYWVRHWASFLTLPVEPNRNCPPAPRLRRDGKRGRRCRRCGRSRALRRLPDHGATARGRGARWRTRVMFHPPASG